MLTERLVAGRLAEARLDTPVIGLVGPRQAGKSTLAQAAGRTGPGEPILLNQLPAPGDASATITTYTTLDDATVLEAVRTDPHGFLEARRNAGWTVIDEVQRSPGLLLAMKREVDLDRRPGRFIVTGSTDLYAVPAIADSLAGRIEFINVWPLSQTELENGANTFLTDVFADTFPLATSRETAFDVARRALRGGYPEALARSIVARRRAWFANYVDTVIQRELHELLTPHDRSVAERVLRATATRSGGPLNIASLSRDTNITQSTLRRNVSLLQAVFLISELPAWSSNVDARIMKSPKFIFNDSGLFAYLFGVEDPADPRTGNVIETFVGAELLRAIAASIDPPTLMHFRDANGSEVDYVLELRDGRIAGIEVKRSTSVTAKDFRGLDRLAGLAGDRFVRGIVLYNGAETLSFSNDGVRKLAVPIAALWR